jgi:hypothetical protein
MTLKTPQFATDLYRDLRDRRLLPVAAVLLVALVAVPVALSETTEPAPPVPAAVPTEATAAEPAVMVEQVGIRNYRERLERFKSKNPFRQHFNLPEATTSALEVVPAGGGVDGGSAAEASSTSAPTSGGGTTTTTVTTPAPPPREPTLHAYTYTLDVKVGVPGDLEEKPKVERLSFLPSNANPLLVYLGASVDGKDALFLVSDDVSSVTTDGECMPDIADCVYLTLHAGQSADLVNSLDTLTYRIKLLSIDQKRVKSQNKHDKQAPDSSW